MILKLKKLNLHQFFLQLEEFLQDECKKTLLTKWDENSITQKIAEKFVNDFSNVEINDLYPTPAKIKSIAYRQSGRNENIYGDLAFFVRIQYPDSRILEGVGFIEAKRTYPKNGEDSINLFEQIDFSQLKRIYAHAPYSYLMLYDHLPVNINIFNTFYDDFRPGFILKKINQPRVIIIPINIAIEIEKKNREMYVYSNLLSQQITSRYLLGKDLHFEKKVKDIARGYSAEIEELRHKYLIVTSVAYGDFEPSPNSVDVNGSRFERIEIE